MDVNLSIIGRSQELIQIIFRREPKRDIQYPIFGGKQQICILRHRYLLPRIILRIEENCMTLATYILTEGIICPHNIYNISSLTIQRNFLQMKIIIWHGTSFPTIFETSLFEFSEAEDKISKIYSRPEKISLTVSPFSTDPIWKHHPIKRRQW